MNATNKNVTFTAAFQNSRKRNDRHLAEKKIVITDSKLIRVRSKNGFV